MPKQTEKPGTNVEELCATLGVSTEGALVSGGQIMHFREGWAKAIFVSGKIGHYYRRYANNIGEVFSACGLSVVAPAQLYGLGNYPRCRKCQRYLDRHGIPQPKNP